jgi:hypothetical protein
MQRWFKILLLFFFFSLFVKELANAQQSTIKNDSTTIYKNIESFSKKRKLTKLMYTLVFKHQASALQRKPANKRRYKRQIQKSYKAFEGKTIRQINIETLDPFGYSVADTLLSPHGFFPKTGNGAHIKSQQITIRNLLLIRENQLFDSLLVKESERLVRTRKYVHDVSFAFTATSKNSDSVDVFIRELDKWSFVPKVSISNSGFGFNLTDKNFIGLGHESNNDFRWDRNNNNYAYKVNYLIPNIRNTYINSTILLSRDLLNMSVKRFAVDRPFFSPFARWAAGARFSQILNDSVYFGDTFLLKHRYKYNVQDYWVGYATPIFKGNTEDKRTTNFISSLRYLRIRYLEKPIEVFDSYQKISNEDFYLASIGISTRKYIQDKYIFKYGETEDVPVGKVYSLTAGYQVKNNSGRLYTGVKFSVGNYNDWGYMSSDFEYGTFFHAGQAEQGVFTANVNYFTGLIEFGKWKFRQFIKPQLIIGTNRFSNDSLTLNDFFELSIANRTALSGNSRLTLDLQTQSYFPWNLFGFHFGPYLIISLSMLGDEITGLKNSKLYSQIGIGVLIKNENLIFSTFQISFSFYPSIPGIGSDIYKVNSFRTTDFGFRDFEIGKPSTVEYL